MYALDIEPEMIAATLTAAGKAGVANVQPIQRDFVVDGTGLPTGSCDYAMVFNLLHIDDPVALLREAFRVLMPGGKLGIIHWNVDPATPRGWLSLRSPRVGYRAVALGPTDAAAVEVLPQFTPGSRITRLVLEPADGCCSREYTPARSADRHRPEAHWRRASILSPAVTATGTTFCAA